ncbi:MAG TPA: BatA domain-containing protein [Sphingobacteriaceae bacterium]|nr:BatA domain-containing protein [Sphingobacteriaceae bacterium]
MNFLYPGFLFALAAISIPVIIHLFNFRRFKKVYFSNVRFLKDVEQQTSSGQKIKNRLILATRILAITFIVLAFAKPYIPDKSNFNSFQSQVISVYIDNSYSMETVNKEGSLLDEAKRRAKEIALAYSLNDKFQLLTNDFEGKHQRLLGYDDFLSAVDEVKISSNNRTADQIISRQSDVFSSEPNSKKNIYLISDFQKNILNSTLIKPDTGISVRMVKLKANSLPNISVDSVWFTSPVHRPGQTEKLVVKLRNNSDKPAPQIPVKLTVNNQQKALGSISLEPRGTKSDTLSFSGLGAGWQSGEISINDYPIVFDDRFYFSFRIRKNLPVLSINGNNPSRYLQAVYRSDQFFQLENTPAGNISYSTIASYPIIILNEVSELSTGLSQQLVAYVRNGGSLVVFPSLTGNQSALGGFLQNINADIPETIVTADTKVISLNQQHAVFTGVFDRIPSNLELPAAKSYLQYSLRNTTNRKAILEFPGRRTFFAEYISGKGRVYLSAVPLDEEASNLVRHSLFVPLMFQTALLSLRNQWLFYTLGREQLIETDKITLSTNQTLKLRGTNFEAIPDVKQLETGTALYLADQIKKTGNYSLTKGDSLLLVLSYNDNRTESDLSYASKKEIEDKFSSDNMKVFQPGSGSVQNAIKAANYGTQLWKVCLILALLFLAVEIVLIRFYNKFHQK